MKRQRDGDNTVHSSDRADEVTYAVIKEEEGDDTKVSSRTSTSTRVNEVTPPPTSSKRQRMSPSLADSASQSIGPGENNASGYQEDLSLVAEQQQWESIILQVNQDVTGWTNQGFQDLLRQHQDNYVSEAQACHEELPALYAEMVGIPRSMGNNRNERSINLQQWFSQHGFYFDDATVSSRLAKLEYAYELYNDQMVDFLMRSFELAEINEMQQEIYALLSAASPFPQIP